MSPDWNDNEQIFASFIVDPEENFKYYTTR